MSITGMVHDRGCTAFWPGSHRYAECAGLGALAANYLCAVVPVAPLQPGDAIVYDTRAVHSDSPNDAYDGRSNRRSGQSMGSDDGGGCSSSDGEELGVDGDAGEMLQLQITYFPHGNTVGKSYGLYELFSD